MYAATAGQALADCSHAVALGRGATAGPTDLAYTEGSLWILRAGNLR